MIFTYFFLCKRETKYDLRVKYFNTVRNASFVTKLDDKYLGNTSYYLQYSEIVVRNQTLRIQPWEYCLYCE